MDKEASIKATKPANIKRMRTGIKAGVWIDCGKTSCNGSWPVGACQGDATGPSM